MISEEPTREIAQNPETTTESGSELHSDADPVHDNNTYVEHRSSPASGVDSMSLATTGEKHALSVCRPKPIRSVYYHLHMEAVPLTLSGTLLIFISLQSN